ncbi:hypothetical protein CQ018_15835 [Arthrobacter sp. MYb227]|uniref:hypothetical protein n=1 Tax=Arthrobacter sp. MYb227 TaxID=1848601 RepID=UPI000CFB0B93|nr:hypothetical protein [Arthrobacter sp. MYb227]PQZ89023.1 hypothetical protein CQ018_15835 [Arthrobacter sp. MYb227]
MNTNHRNIVGEFARAVRAQLADLPALDVEELTEGLEADLTERLAEDGSDLGDPAAYAAELRASAGLQAKAPVLAALSLRRSLETKVRGAIASLRAKPATAALLDFLVALRPVWWVLRGWIVFGLLIVLVKQDWPFFPRGLLEFLLWAGVIAVSVQWGRGRWLGSGRAGKGLKYATSVVAAVLLLPMALVAFDSVNRALYSQSYDYASAASAVSDGLSLDGENVSNVFAYDCSGQPLRNVQLFSENGTKLSVNPFGDGYSSYPDKEEQADVFGLPSQFVAGHEGWNVFPLDATVQDPYESEGADLGRMQAPLPFDTVQPLLNECSPEAPKEKEAALPSTMPTAPTLKPEDVKATDVKSAVESGATESGTPSPSPTDPEVEESTRDSGTERDKPATGSSVPTPAPSGSPSPSEEK